MIDFLARPEIRTPIEFTTDQTETYQWRSSGLAWSSEREGTKQFLRSWKLTDRVTLQELWGMYFRDIPWISKTQNYIDRYPTAFEINQVGSYRGLKR